MSWSRPSQNKRQRERQQQERRAAKQAKRTARRTDSPATRTPGVDPDLEGIELGPQPLQDWQKTE
ncbi:MAG TPA: hypothetical protein VNE16_16955 [Vicinamibacterales bacterium]|nr:hypothetical protein [Vicinamibacterales bacterium]